MAKADESKAKAGGAQQTGEKSEGFICGKAGGARQADESLSEGGRGRTIAGRTIKIDSKKFNDILSLLREAKDKIDVASGIVDWTKEDAEDSGEECFGEHVCDRIEEVLDKYKA
jgi:hypothetical protein